jgi:integrase/recombinase XerD
MGGISPADHALDITPAAPQAGLSSTDNVVAAFLALLKQDQLTAQSARLYLGHLRRFGVRLRGQYQAELLDATSHDLREYRAQLAADQQPASVNAAFAVLRRFYRWALATGRIKADLTARVKPLASQPLAPKGFTSVERQRLRREAERAGPMADPIVTTLLNTGLRVDELVHLTWETVVLRDRSGHASIKSDRQ